LYTEGKKLPTEQKPKESPSQPFNAALKVASKAKLKYVRTESFSRVARELDGKKKLSYLYG